MTVPITTGRRDATDAPASARIRSRLPRFTLNPWFWFVIVLAGGSALRLVGLGWGLPLQLHPDEWVVVRGAIDMAERNSFEPAAFSRPDHLEIQLTYFAYMLYGYLVHGAPPELVYADDQAPFYLIARAVIAVLGILCIPLGMMIGRRLSPRIGVLTAATIAFFPPLISNSHYATPDVPLVLAGLIVVYACMRYMESPGWVWLLSACAAVAVGFIAKYPGALAGVIVAACVIVAGLRDHAGRRTVAHLLVAPVAFLVCVFVLSPVLFTNFTAVREQLVGQNSTGHLGADGLGFFGNLGFYADDGFRYFGVLMTLLALLGAWRLVTQRVLIALPYLIGVVMWLGISVLTLHWNRWGLPMYTTVLLLAPVGMAHLADVLRAARLGRAAAPVAATVVGIVLANQIATSAAALVGFTAPDNRAEALKYFEANGITQDNTVYEGYTPLLPGAPWPIFDSFETVDGRLRVSADDERAPRARYVVTSSGMYGRYLREARYAREQEFYEQLDEQFVEVRRWSSSNIDAAVTPLEPLNVVRQLRHVARGVAGDVTAGPTIVLYEMPDPAGR